MLPVSEAWYQKLLLAALVLGIGGGVIALIYSGVTGFGIELFYGEPTSEVWSGQWWWIPLISAGAVVVVALRGVWSVPEKVPGAVAIAKSGWVEPASALNLMLISMISLFVGASLGPSFGIVVAGGGMGAWIVKRSSTMDTESQHEFALAGMAAGLGALFSAPLFAAIMATELSSTPKKHYVTAFIPQFIASTIGYVIFFGITGKVMLDAFEIPGYTYETVHLLYGLVLGVFAVLTLLAQSLIGNAVRRAAAEIHNQYARAVLGGALIGLIAFALPLTATGGTSQLSYATANAQSFAIALLLAVLVGKMVAITLSQEAGFLGGTVFPILFIGGTAGIVVHAIFPDIPIALAVAGMIAAVPGAIIGAPVSFILIGVGGVGLGVSAIAPIGIAVVTSYLTMSTIKMFAEARDSM